MIEFVYLPGQEKWDKGFLGFDRKAPF